MTYRNKYTPQIEIINQHKVTNNSWLSHLEKGNRLGMYVVDKSGSCLSIYAKGIKVLNVINLCTGTLKGHKTVKNT